MERISITKPSASTMIGSYTQEDPRRLADGVEACVDMYTAALYYCYYSGRDAWKTCYHLYKYKVKDKNNLQSGKIRVEAKDRYGNIFTETEITEGTDYSLVSRK
jgi:hypothetical protein